MESILDLVLRRYEIFILVFVRVIGIFLISPIFSRSNIPNIMKLVFAFLTSMLLTNVLDINNIEYTDFELVSLIIKELMIGLIIGFISYLFFSVFYLAGQLIDTQIGFGMVNVLDPMNNIQAPIMGNFLQILALLIFLLINGHHVFISGVASSFEVLPIGHFSIDKIMISQFINIVQQTFIIAFKISSPIIATIFVVDIVLGILARIMPQMNVFVVGMPLKIIAGITTLIIIIPVFIIALQHIFDNMYEEIFKFLQQLNKG